ncbi:MAG: glycosyltransferase family 39 protein [Candidatus Paceibacterota bacterium]|jgi:hypothetical protein
MKPEAAQDSYNERLLFGLGLLARLSAFFLLLFFYGAGAFYAANNGISITGNDLQNYLLDARNLVHHGVYSRFPDPPFQPDSFRTPLFPLLLAPAVYFFGISGIWIAVLVLDVFLSGIGIYVYRLAQLFLSKNASFIAGLLIVIWPLLAYQTNLLEPDALFVFLFVYVIYRLVRFSRTEKTTDLVLSAVALGLSILAKPVGTYLIPLLALWIGCMCYRKLKIATAVRHALLFIALSSLVLVPWVIRNKIVFGVAELSSITAYNFYAYHTHDFIFADESQPIAPSQVREPERNLSYSSQYMHVVLQRISHNPIGYAGEHFVGFIRNLVANDLSAIYYLDHAKIIPFPYNPETKDPWSEFLKYATQFVFVFVYLAIGSLLWKVRKNKDLYYTLLLFAFCVLYFTITPGPSSNPKYRLPALPFIVILFVYFCEYMKKTPKTRPVDTRQS